MKPFVLVMGNADYNTGEGSKPTLIGIVDPTNAKNFVSTLSILKGDTDTVIPTNRIAEVLYNLGIKLSINAHIANLGGIRIEGFSVTPDLRDEVNPRMFRKVEVSTDIWDFVDDNGSTPLTVKQEIADALKNAGVAFTEEEFLTIVSNLAIDAYNVLFNQYYPMEGYGAEKQNYSVYSANIPVSISNVNNLESRVGNKPKVMAYPDGDLPLQVPTFYELMCYKKYTQNNEKIALNSLGNVDDEENSATYAGYTEDSETHLFNDADYSYEDIYLPKYMYNARTMDMSNDGSFEIPIINPNLINVRSVTQFWEVVPARKIPVDAYGHNADNKLYVLEDLIGHANNNHLPLQDNERKYYSQLDRLLTIAVSIEHNALSDEVYATVKDKTSTVVEDYCKTLAEEAFNLMWCHTGTTQSVYPEFYNEDDDDTESESSEITSKYRLPCKYGNVEKGENGIYKFTPTIAGFVQGASSEAIAASIRKSLPRLYLGFDGDAEAGFVHHSGALVGYINSSPSNHRWIDALIRLLRWGNRKPSMLTTEDIRHGAERPEKYWDLNSASVSSNDGCIDNLQPEINEATGNEYNLVAVITADVFAPVNLINMFYPGISDKVSFTGTSNVHIPIGVAFEVKMQGSHTYKTYYEDIFTYADKLKKGNSRGNIVYENGVFKCFNGDESVFIGEIDITDVNKYLEVGAVNQTITDIDENGKEVLRDIFIKFMTTSNSQIMSTRKAFASKCSDAKRYASLSDGKNLFTAITEYIGVSIKNNFLSVGKQIIMTNKLPNTIVANPENTRIVFMFLDKLLRLAYSPTMYENQPMCNLTGTLNKLEEVFNEATTPISNTDTVFDEFVKLVSKDIDKYIIMRFKKADSYHDMVLGVARDLAEQTILFSCLEDLEKLKQELGPDASKLRIHDKMLGDKHVKFFSNAIKIYNKNGKKVDKTKFEIKNGIVLMSSDKAMQLIYNNFNK